MTDNLKLWKRFEDIDPQFTKKITGKPYQGTSPNPHYVIMCLTELFGPVGEGFGWEVTGEGFQPLGEEVLHWCRIRFWHGKGAGFDAYGQTKALMKTRNGMMSDEDAPKKSLTDAITKAAAQIGVGANIFLGRWDDNKYVAEVNDTYRKAEQPQRATDNPQTDKEVAETFDWAGEALELKRMVQGATQRDYLTKLGKTDRFQRFKDEAPQSLVQQVGDAFKAKLATYEQVAA